MVYSDSDPDVRRVRYEVRQFKNHLLIYLAVVGVLILANLVSGWWWDGSWLLFWVAFIWGVVLALQGAKLFGDHLGLEWEERMVAHIVEKRRAARPASQGAPSSPPPGGPIITPPPPG